MRSSEKGGYSPSVLKQDFITLWNTGFFENITIEAEDGEEGKIVKVILKENLLIKSITYKTGEKSKGE